MKLHAAFLLLLLASPAAASDTWTDPHPGLRYLHRVTSDPMQIHVLQVDLCNPGVSFRATPPPADLASYPGQITSQFASTQGVQAAVNAAFYDTSTHIPIGLAMGAGERWAPTGDGTTTGLLGLGRENHLMFSFPEELVSTPPPWMQDSVSTMGVLLRDGVVVHDTLVDHFTSRNPRTGVGISQDRRTLYLAVVDGRSTASIGMTTVQLAQLFLDLGAYDALNFDGGGSTTMWIQGTGVVNVPSDGSQRRVANHLGVYAAEAPGQPSLCCTPQAVAGAEDSEFKDLPRSHWGYNAALALKNAGITTGCSTNPPLFCPDCRLNRTQMAVFLVSALGLTEYRPAQPSFQDVPTDHWAYGYIERIKQLGFTQGCSSSPALFCPDESVTRAQAAIFLVRAAGFTTVTPGTASFSDVPATDAAYPYVETLKAQCITQGCSAGHYCPAQAMTRMEAAVMLQRTFGIGIAAGCGVVDAGVADASRPDAWVPDASQPDAWVPDASQPDAWVPDASQPDAWTPDAWVADSSVPDAMTVADAALPADASFPEDSGTPAADSGSPPDATVTGRDSGGAYIEVDASVGDEAFGNGSESSCTCLTTSTTPSGWLLLLAGALVLSRRPRR